MAGDLIRIICVTVALVIAVTLLSWLASKPANGTPVCLTKKEARVLWPKRHLYWYGNDHCWSNRRGGPPRNLRYDLIRDNHAQAEPALPYEKPATKEAGKADRVVAPSDTVRQQSDEWPVAAKPIRIIEIIRPEVPMPAMPVEAADLPPPQKPPASKLSIIAPIGGALSAILLAIFLPFSERTINYVKSSTLRLHKRIGSAREKIRTISFGARNRQSPIHQGDIRDFIRRVDRARHDAHLAAVLDRITDPGADIDHSAIACWSRAIRTEKNT